MQASMLGPENPSEHRDNDWQPNRKFPLQKRNSAPEIVDLSPHLVNRGIYTAKTIINATETVFVGGIMFLQGSFDASEISRTNRFSHVMNFFTTIALLRKYLVDLQRKGR